MKISVIVLTLILVALIVLGGCLQQPPQAGSATGEGTQPTHQPTQDELWMQRALEERNRELCQNISDAAMRTRCLAYIPE